MIKKLALSAAIGLWAATATAHSPLKSTVPANEASVAVAPKSISLVFKGKIRLTRVTLGHADNDTVLDLDKDAGFTTDHSVALPPAGVGLYTITWRGLGMDGHALRGGFSFMVE